MLYKKNVWFRDDVLKDMPRVKGRPGIDLAPLDMSFLKSDLEAKLEKTLSDVDVMSAALYPKVTQELLPLYNTLTQSYCQLQGTSLKFVDFLLLYRLFFTSDWL